MPKLYHNDELVDNDWVVLPRDFGETGREVPAKALVPLEYWLAHSAELSSKADIGVWLDSDESPEALADHCDSLKLIAINFPVFSDGRGYSYAQILRNTYSYMGELRAIGDVLRDQMFFYQRVGFDSFALREDRDASVALKGLQDFSNPYQAAQDNPTPLFRRR